MTKAYPRFVSLIVVDLCAQQNHALAARNLPSVAWRVVGFLFFSALAHCTPSSRFFLLVMKSNKLLVRKKWPSAIRTWPINRPCGPRVPSMVATSLPRESSRTCVFFASHASYSRAFGGAHPPRRTRVSWHRHVVIERKRRTQKEEVILR